MAVVVDSKLKVRGIKGLRVIDSSVFPTVPSTNLNAPTIMLVERASDILRGTPCSPHRTPPSHPASPGPSAPAAGFVLSA